MYVYTIVYNRYCKSQKIILLNFDLQLLGEKLLELRNLKKMFPQIPVIHLSMVGAAVITTTLKTR